MGLPGTTTARALWLACLLAWGGCGRTELGLPLPAENDDTLGATGAAGWTVPARGGGTRDAGPPRANLPDWAEPAPPAPPPDPPPDPPPELATCLREDFEAGAGDWALGALWSVVEDPAPGQGQVLQGHWQSCPEEISMAASTRDVSFAGADLPVLSFNHYGEQSFNDTLRVLLSTDGGQSWEEAAVVPEPNFEWNPVRLELPRWAGEPRVRVAFDFHNVCGDPYGVRWWLDDVALCGWLPTLPD